MKKFFISFFYSINFTNLIKGMSPRFLVITAPSYGRLLLDGNFNGSVFFFTFADINSRRLAYYATDSGEELADSVELQLDADGIQPARFRFLSCCFFKYNFAVSKIFNGIKILSFFFYQSANTI